ncbi:MAG: hypothetical protein Q9160_002064 [Pyrenula sp. 1 TL-2023]
MVQLVWLITGCSSGFGEQFVSDVLERGDRVIATARNGVSRLQHLADIGAATLELDVTSSQTDLNVGIEKACGIYGRIEVLVNNAGYVSVGTVEESTYEYLLNQFNTNLFGALNVTRAVLPLFRKQRSGFVVFISSPSGWEGLPGAGAYTGTKFALEGMYECLKSEVAPFAIQSIIFELGHFRTPIMSPGRLKFCSQTVEDYTEMTKGFASLLSGFDMSQPGDPKKAVKIMVDMVKGKGVAAEKTMPARLPLGSDVLEVVRRKCRDTLAICDEWEKVIVSTNFD